MSNRFAQWCICQTTSSFQPNVSRHSRDYRDRSHYPSRS